MQVRSSWWVYDRYTQLSRGKPSSPAALHLDVTAMREAASLLLGCQDCTALMDTRKAAGLFPWSMLAGCSSSG